MRSEELDRALGETTQSFARRMDRTLLSLKEEEPVKRTAFRTVLAVALMIALLGSTAFALVSQGLEWYYSNRFTAYQEHEPERYAAIMNNLQFQVPQTVANDPEISFVVEEVSWAPEEKVMVVSILATPADPETTELYPMWELDLDGSYVGKENLELYAEDEEARDEHWLWTENGHGPVAEMIAPGKQLLLLEMDEIFLDGDRLVGDGSMMDYYVTEDGVVHVVHEIRLDQLEPGYIEGLEQQLEEHPEFVFLKSQIRVAKRLLEILETSETLELSIPYTVTPYTEDDAELYGGGREGEISFTVDIK